MLRANKKIADYYPPDASDFVDPHRVAYTKRSQWPDLQDQFSNTPYRYGALVRKGWGQVHKNYISTQPCRPNFTKMLGEDGTVWCVPSETKSINNYHPTFRPQNDFSAQADTEVRPNIFHDNSINPFTGERQYFHQSKPSVMRGHRVERSRQVRNPTREWLI